MSDAIWDNIDGTIGYYDRKGRRISMREWSKLFEDGDYKNVQQTTVGDRWLVSTVWLGLDHNLIGTGPPLIFETMIFDTTAGGLDRYWDLAMQRYSTEAEAIEGHCRMVEVANEVPTERRR